MAHEDLQRENVVEHSSDRAFGFVMAGAFSVLALWPLVHRGSPRVWALVAAMVFGGVALIAPRWLAAPNRAWTALGLAIGRVVAPVATGLLFYGVFTPIGGWMRWRGQDPMRLSRDPAAASYWIRRDPPGPDPRSLDRQF